MKRIAVYISVACVAVVALAAAQPSTSLRDEKEPLGVLHADGFGSPPIVLINRVTKRVYFVETDITKTNGVIFVKAIIPESSLVVRDSHGEITVRVRKREFSKIELDRIKPQKGQHHPEPYPEPLTVQER